MPTTFPSLFRSRPETVTSPNSETGPGHSFGKPQNISTVIATGGLVGGSYCHCLTLSIAAWKSSGGPLRGLAPETRPFASTTTLNVTFPSICFFLASSGYGANGELSSLGRVPCWPLHCICGVVSLCARTEGWLLIVRNATAKKRDRRQSLILPLLLLRFYIETVARNILVAASTPDLSGYRRLTHYFSLAFSKRTIPQSRRAARRASARVCRILAQHSRGPRPKNPASALTKKQIRRRRIPREENRKAAALLPCESAGPLPSSRP